MISEDANRRRRTDALSRSRILDAAVAILDRDGAAGLTLRAVMAELSTGSGAIYHHVATMDELRAAAADSVVGRSLADRSDHLEPAAALRADAAAIFDALIEHGWLAAQLARDPFQPAVLHIWTNIGAQLSRLGITGRALAESGFTLSAYILGSAVQQSTSRPPRTEHERSELLTALAEHWRSLYRDPLVEEAAQELAQHDDRVQFLAGVDIVLAGISTRV